ncbi:uncharacterized protein LY89DRAFT_777054 [Mollisia scopiformis]|uniref:MYND-type domain-containing protein n=1 Tax=Mollisia scopiformis TaxID=149040 RepID=A0A194XSZ7_MOLSC|nr:uncharacterized protein LY89DRAFT_777054 [Mollisia scopiformis]KUJ23271.1 hypothetical protein LY89DRAFT_777054 [Mollisia scopiformis]
MSLFPDFSNEEIFPTFAQCPLKETLSESTSTTTQFLMGTIGENMTLAMNPTFICKDRSTAPYALTLKLPSHMHREGVRGGALDFKQYKKGWTVVVRAPCRSGVKDGKQGLVECELEESLVIPASLEKLAGMHNREWTKAFGDEGTVECQGCGETKSKDELSRCKGCGAVWYCNRECQTKGWSEKDHKSECKALKALRSPLLDPARVQLVMS